MIVLAPQPAGAQAIVSPQRLAAGRNRPGALIARLLFIKRREDDHERANQK